MYTSVYYTASTHTRAYVYTTYVVRIRMGTTDFFSSPFPFPIPLWTNTERMPRGFFNYTSRGSADAILFLALREPIEHDTLVRHPLVSVVRQKRVSRGRRGVQLPRARVCSDDTRYIIYTRTPTHTHSHSHLDTRRRRFIIIQYGRVPTATAFEHTHTLSIILYISHLYTYAYQFSVFPFRRTIHTDIIYHTQFHLYINQRHRSTATIVLWL